MFREGAGRGDKSLLDIGGQSMISLVIERLQPQVGCVLLNANGDPHRFASLGLPVVADTVEGFVGPLAGLLAGLRWTAQNVPDATHVVSTSSDAPFLPRDLVQRLATAVDQRPRAIALAMSGGELHPVIGLWPVVLADDLDAKLAAGVRAVRRFADAHALVPVDFPFIEIADRTIDPFFNANTPEELDEARRLLALKPA